MDVASGAYARRKIKYFNKPRVETRPEMENDATCETKGKHTRLAALHEIADKESSVAFTHDRDGSAGACVKYNA